MGKSLQNSEFSRYATGQLVSADATRERIYTTMRFAVWNSLQNLIEVPVERDIYIGRTSAADPIAVDLTPYNAQTLGVSRKHALIRKFAHKFVLIDLDSTNGTMLNGKKIQPNKAYFLKVGDEIQIGGVVLKFMLL